jgi:hypothetical protein
MACRSRLQRAQPQRSSPVDGPRASGLTVTTIQNGNFTPGTDPQDAKRQFSLIATMRVWSVQGTATRH